MTLLRCKTARDRAKKSGEDVIRINFIHLRLSKGVTPDRDSWTLGLLL